MTRLLKAMTQTISILLISQSSFAENSLISLENDVLNLSAEKIKHRLNAKAGVFDLKYSEAVKNDIKSYLIGGKKTTQKILSRRQIYFPIIERYLKINQLPEELKYLTIIESALNPNAISSAGAVGLWQLMPTTARRFGLKINSQVDERRDPHKSTQAALKYLTFLHELLGDWTLAVAAYNCGGGGVQKAMRLGKGQDFWSIKSHLPTQTQHYIDRLASVVYVMNYYQDYGLEVEKNDYYVKFTKVATVYSKLTFQQISQALDIPIPVLKQLNPSYRKEIVPDSLSGNYLTLPKLKMNRFINYYNEIVADERKITN